ncbi:MAG: hypothetical protein J2O48_07150 [Solirubrobacterales bacterium]|nr:hypothetical protein [Solirubrobacterales bacterium]
MPGSRSRPPKAPTSPWVLLLRHGLPLALVIAGIVLIALAGGHLHDVKQMSQQQNVFVATPTDTDSMLSAIGVGAIIAAIMIWLFGYMVRLSLTSSSDRDKEEAAREYFARTGRWPGAGAR